MPQRETGRSLEFQFLTTKLGRN
uniref:Uncharacterized protein n=1 Tax=Rhizophora mucronata TaxID=61149 RepID=A0A2P2PEH4_RHIMU